MADLIRAERAFVSMFKFAGIQPYVRKKLLETLSNPQIKVFAQLAHNALYKVIPLTQRQKSALSKLKQPLIRILASKTISLKRKKAALVKHHNQAHELINQLFPIIKRLIWKRK